MKKVVVSLVFAGILLGSAPLDAAVSKMRAVKCAIPRLHAKFNCTDEEKAVGRKWLKGATIAAAVAALAALVVGGVKLAEVQAEKKRVTEQLEKDYQQAHRDTQVATAERKVFEAEWALGKKDFSQMDIMIALTDALTYLPIDKYNHLLDVIIKNNVEVFGMIQLLDRAIAGIIQQPIDRPEVSGMRNILTKIRRDLGEIRAKQLLSAQKSMAAAPAA